MYKFNLSSILSGGFPKVSRVRVGSFLLILMVITAAIFTFIRMTCSPWVAVTFTGYSNGCSTAILQLTNLTDSEILCAPRLEIRSGDRWQKFEYDYATTEWASFSVGVVLNPHGSWDMSFPIPSDSPCWRVVMHCQKDPYAQVSALRSKLNSVLNFFGISTAHSEMDIASCPQTK